MMSSARTLQPKAITARLSVIPSAQRRNIRPRSVAGNAKTVRLGSRSSRHVIRRAATEDEAEPMEEAEVEVVEEVAKVEDEAPMKTVDVKSAAAAIAIGLVIRYVIPCPGGVTMQAWQLLAIFVSTIAGLVLQPLPVGAWAFLGLTTAVLTKTVTFAAAFSAFQNEVIWLIVISFFFAKGFVKTGFGDRLALLFVRAFGKNTLSLAYGLQAAECAICPAMPSTTARAGGVFVPVINSLDIKTRAYLVAQQLQGGNSSSSIVLTAAAQNFLCLKLAGDLGVSFGNSFVTWFTAASVPAICAILALPYVMYLIDPPEVKETPEAPAKAAEALKVMGPVKKSEKLMMAGLGVTVFLWVMGEALGVSAVLAAMIGLSILLCTGVLSWNDALEEKNAWDTLMWFAVLIGMSGQLNAMGLIGWVAQSVSGVLTSLSMGTASCFVFLHFLYFVVHYLFASQTAHVGALYTAFLAMMLAAGCPGVLSALTLAFNTNLFGGMTHFASGQAAVYFGTKYIELPTLWKQGAYCAVLNFLIWGVVGGIWWKIIGLY